ncbi:unnamed protein product [Ilex paraguariensis]|uniref:Uncharacterized protein n=1 Tax=Ilex paraguariensis TaxID=185542 RepID=A0ABC8SET2_9AQUA
MFVTLTLLSPRHKCNLQSRGHVLTLSIHESVDIHISLQNKPVLTSDNNDPAKLKLKLEKIDVKIQALVTKREDILKQINEAEKSTANPSGDACPPASA